MSESGEAIGTDQGNMETREGGKETENQDNFATFFRKAKMEGTNSGRGYDVKPHIRIVKNNKGMEG